MKRAAAIQCLVASVLVSCPLLTSEACAQPNAPSVGYVFPAGGQQGSSFEIWVGGRGLRGVKQVIVSGQGVQATVVEHRAPIFGKKQAEMREELKTLREKRTAAIKAARDQKGAAKPTWSDADKERAIEIVTSLFVAKKKQATPAIIETVVVKVTVDPGAATGLRELRLVAPNGVSNPMVFAIGTLPEVRETELRYGDPPQYLLRFLGGKRPGPGGDKAPAEMAVTLPTVINGQIMPGDIDRYRFDAPKGQRIVAAASARTLIPYLADAVPGWFQAVIAIYDARGNELAYADDYRFNPDPLLCYEIPEDGQYIVEIRDAIYRGREDFVYRLAIGELPFVTGIFPLGGRVGHTTPVEVTGWNLPAGKLSPAFASAGTHALTVPGLGWTHNPIAFAAGTLPEQFDREPNNSAAAAQAVTLPVIVNGRIDSPGDSDVLSFKGRKGQKIVAEVQARRLGSPHDSQLLLTDAKGKQVAFNDDCADKCEGLLTHHADPRLAATLPRDGTYYLHVSDTQGHSGPEYAYRLRISPPQSDFALRIVPSSITLRGGQTMPLTIHAMRSEGFNGPIDLALVDAPEGFALTAARIPAGQDEVRMTLTAPPAKANALLTLGIVGRGAGATGEITRPAVPAEDRMQAFLWRHLVCAETFQVLLIKGWGRQRGVKVLSGTPVAIPVGGTARVKIAMPLKIGKGTIQLELDHPPDGVTMKLEPAGLTTDLILKGDATRAQAGLAGNLIVNAYFMPAPPAAKPADPKAKPAAKPKRPNRKARRWPVGTLPAIPFAIVEK